MDVQDVYDAAGIRPPNITNTDTRLMANAVRLHIEPALDIIVSPMQRGFVGGRSVLANTIDIEESMIHTTARHDEGGAVLFDFAAAFSSIDHSFLLVGQRLRRD